LKRRLTFSELHGVISQKTVLFIHSVYFLVWSTAEVANDIRGKNDHINFLLNALEINAGHILIEVSYICSCI
jgi:hypothetical protein